MTLQSAASMAALALVLVARAALAVTSTVDPTGNAGLASSLQLNAGKPVIAYTRDGNVMLATCTANCTTATPTWVIATVASGTWPSLQLDNGDPVVSYYDSGAIKLATCTAGCATATPTWVTATVLASNGSHAPLGLSSGVPVVAYIDTSVQEVRLATCSADCKTASPAWVRSTVATLGGAFYFQGVSLAMDGATPWVGYDRFIGGGSLHSAACTANCASASATWVSSPVDTNLQGHALQLRSGLPAFAYHSSPMIDRDLKYAVCTADCDTPSANWIRSTVDAAGNAGRGASLQFQAGLPIISYIDGARKLKVARCTANCLTASPTWAFETVDDGDGATSLVISGSVALATYQDYVNLDLRYAAILSGAPALQLSATSLDFGVQSMGTTSAPQAVTLTNAGGSTLTIGTVAGTGPARVNNTCTSLAPLESCTLPVSFYAAPDPAAALNAVSPAGGMVGIPSNALDSPHQVTVTGSVEKSLVHHYYRSILRREPDAGGRDFWRNAAARVVALGANVNETWFAMAQVFFFSPEYLAAPRDNPAFVTDLYRTFFNREPDPGGLTFWVDQRAAGLPREVLLAEFMFSAEFRNFTQGVFGSPTSRAEVDAIMDFYRALLARLPDDAGFNYWVGRFRAAQCSGSAAVVSEVEAISKAFVESGEYVARSRNNAQFVGDLYNGFLRRGGDLAGVQYWVDQVATGARSRDQVRVEFKNSPEFQARVQAIVQQGCVS